jgi:hypothetical protein
LPTHPLAVLPLKLWRPRWFDGVALATGACAPDFAYALDGIGVRIHGHTLAALLWWCLPTAVATAWLIRRAAPAVAAHLPGPRRDYGELGRVRHRGFVTAASAVLGGASHLLWDLVTHPGPVAAWWPIRQASDYAALLLFPLFVWYCARSGRLREWHGAPPAVPRRPALFWGVSAAVAGAGGLLTWALGDLGPAWFGNPVDVHVTGVRLIASVTAGLLAGALAVQSARVAGNRTAPVASLPRR